MAYSHRTGKPDGRRKQNGSQAKRTGARKAANTRRINKHK